MVLTNHKVMTTTLFSMPRLREYKPRRAVLATLFARPRYDAYCLVRNPYQRLQSFFRDGFRCLPQDLENEHSRVFLLRRAVLARSAQLSPQKHPHRQPSVQLHLAELRQECLNLSFEDFIATLPACHPYDGHICPQHWVANPSLAMRVAWFWVPPTCLRWWRRRFWSLLLPRRFPRVELRILHMEEASEIALLGNAIGYDLSAAEHHKHRTSHLSHLQEETRYSRRSLAIVNEVYREDFRRFGYPMYSDPEELEAAGVLGPVRSSAA